MPAQHPPFTGSEPKERAILPLDGFHVSRSLKKTLLSDRYETTADRAFTDIVALCAESADDRPDTWINAQIETAIAELHARGYAHSIETWADGQLVGGLYGIAIGRAFFGESMVSRATDASKVALAHLVARPAGRRLYPARLPVHDRSPRLAGRRRDQPRRLHRVA